MMFKVIVAAALVACTLAAAHTGGNGTQAAGNGTVPHGHASNATHAKATEAEIKEQYETTCAKDFGHLVPATTAAPDATASNATAAGRVRRAGHAATCAALIKDYEKALGCKSRARRFGPSRERRAGHAAAICALLKEGDLKVQVAVADAAVAKECAAATTAATNATASNATAAGRVRRAAHTESQACKDAKAKKAAADKAAGGSAPVATTPAANGEAGEAPVNPATTIAPSSASTLAAGFSAAVAVAVAQLC